METKTKTEAVSDIYAAARDAKESSTLAYNLLYRLANETPTTDDDYDEILAAKKLAAETKEAADKAYYASYRLRDKN